MKAKAERLSSAQVKGGGEALWWQGQKEGCQGSCAALGRSLRCLSSCGQKKQWRGQSFTRRALSVCWDAGIDECLKVAQHWEQSCAARSSTQVAKILFSSCRTCVLGPLIIMVLLYGDAMAPRLLRVPCGGALLCSCHPNQAHGGSFSSPCWGEAPMGYTATRGAAPHSGWCLWMQRESRRGTTFPWPLPLRSPDVVWENKLPWRLHGEVGCWLASSPSLSGSSAHRQQAEQPVLLLLNHEPKLLLLSVEEPFISGTQHSCFTHAPLLPPPWSQCCPVASQAFLRQQTVTPQAWATAPGTVISL